jgi:hypothetical protein
MITLLLDLLRLLPFLHRQLALENLALRHRLTVYKRTVNRPTLRPSDRLFWVALSRGWAESRQERLHALDAAGTLVELPHTPPSSRQARHPSSMCRSDS